MIRPPPGSTLTHTPFPYTTLFRSRHLRRSRRTVRVTRNPSGRHSRSMVPPSCPLARRPSKLPNPSSPGSSLRGPPRPSQIKASVSFFATHSTVTVPDGYDNAPYYAALVASSRGVSALLVIAFS